MVHTLLFMLVDKALDHAAIEVIRGEGVGGEEVVAQHRFKLAAEPLADWNGKAHFLSPEHPRRQVLRERFAKHPFGAAFEQLVGRQAGGELHQFVVHEWTANFERVQHRRPIQLGQQVVRKVGDAVGRKRGLHVIPLLLKRPVNR